MEMLRQDWVAIWALYSPDKIAVKEYDSGRTITYRDLDLTGNRVVRYFQRQLGLNKGDRIAIIAENCLEYIVLFVAAQKAGFIVVPLNYRLTGNELVRLILDCDPSLVISEAKYLPTVSGLELYEGVGNTISLEEFSNLTSSLSRSPEDEVEAITPVGEDDPIFILYTSGTTGLPKGALYTHKMLFWNSINTAMSLIVNSESRTVNCMPPFHTGGWNVLTTPFLHHGGYTCILKKFDPGIVLQLLAEEEVTIFMGVPTMLNMIAQLPKFNAISLPNLYYIIVGGEPMPIPLIEKWHSKGIPIRQGFGMTEVGPNLTSLHQKDAIRKKGSIGRPNFYIDIDVVDEHDQTVPAGHRGQLLFRGPVVTPGYWQNPEATERCIRNGWFYSGDIVIRDNEGYLFAVDRIKNMYISGGENVYPAEIERILQEHPGILEAVVVGVPDETWGESGKAFIVTTPDAGLTKQKLTIYCKQHLARYKIPKDYAFVDSIPKNETGKIDRAQLR